MSDASLPPAAPSGAVLPGIAARSRRYAAYIFWLMFGISLLNYADRYIFNAFETELRVAFGFDHAQYGALASAFIIVYTLVAYPLGLVADRLSRKNIVAAGVALWSLATMLTAFASNFGAMLLVRALVGIGEGSYFPAGTPLLAAWYPPRERARVMGRWGTGLLVGAGLGFGVAAVFAGANFHLAFLFAGAPGLVLAFLMWRTREKRQHEEDPPIAEIGERPSIWARTRTYLRIPTLRVILAMHALGFFSLYALTVFLTGYLEVTYGRTAYPNAGLAPLWVKLVPGVLLIVGGVSGKLAGGAWADRAGKRDPGARVRVAGLGFFWAMPCVAVTLAAPYALRALPAFTALAEGTQVTVGLVVFSLFGLASTFFLNVFDGPSTAALQDVVPSHERAAAGGLELTLAHLLGDSYAGLLVGALAVWLASGLGGDQIGLALLITCPITLAAAGIVGIWGSRFYAGDVAKLGSSAEALLGATPPAAHG